MSIHWGLLTTTTSAQILAYGLLGWKWTPIFFASPHFNNLTNSKSTWHIVGKNPGSYNYKDRGYLNCITKNQFIKNNLCELEGEMKDGTFYLGNELFDSILKNINDIEFINPYPLYCNNSKCYNFINNNLIYYDHHHFTYEGSKPLVDEIINRVLK